LVLVGLMGAGKTSVGRRCAERLGRRFVDTDEVVEASHGATVADIFASEGEEAFRALERDAVASAAASADPLVIACGGGAVLDAGSRERLRETGTVVWLRADPETLGARVGRQPGTRPLLADGPATATLEALAVARADAYAAAAHAVVDTDGRTQDEVADAVLDTFAASGAT
jgi:shikimate kinase